VITLHQGDCLEVLRGLADASVSAIVTDPPYALTSAQGKGFMGKAWDGALPGVEVWAECLRVARPGAHLLAFGGTRTHHRLMCAIEDAGWEIRDCLMWVYGSGFPKSLDVSKAIDKQRQDNPAWEAVGAWLKGERQRAGVSLKGLCEAIGEHGAVNHGGAVSNWENGFSCPTWEQWEAMRRVLRFGAEMDAEVWRLNGRKGKPGDAWAGREIIGHNDRPAGWFTSRDGHDITAPATDAARRWAGWGTALKPAWEIIVLARKPLDGTVAGNVLAHGTGALNIDGCRVEGVVPQVTQGVTRRAAEGQAIYGAGHDRRRAPQESNPHPSGRWPPNFLLSHHPDCNGSCVDQCPVRGLDAQAGERPSGGVPPRRKPTDNGFSGGWTGNDITEGIYASSGGASRFYPCFAWEADDFFPLFYCPKASRAERGAGNTHPTVKPLALMRWLARLVCPPGGLLLDPFCGSGSTLLAADAEGFDALGCDDDPESVAIARRRLDAARAGTPLFTS
jgi:hypothetical protein